jgi:hypothetical protein
MIVIIAGYLSGAAILLSFVPYIRDIFAGKTKPERMAWLIWGVLGSIAFASQLAKGGTHSLVLAGAQTAGDLFVFILAIKYGLGGLKKQDIFAFGGAMVGLLLWNLTKEASVALIITILIDAIGVVLTVIKSYERPETETVSSWVLTFFGGLFACVAVGSFNPILLFFPFYVCLASLSILISIQIGFKKIFTKN